MKSMLKAVILLTVAASMEGIGFVSAATISQEDSDIRDTHQAVLICANETAEEGDEGTERWRKGVDDVVKDCAGAKDRIIKTVKLYPRNPSLLRNIHEMVLFGHLKGDERFIGDYCGKVIQYFVGAPEASNDSKDDFESVCKKTVDEARRKPEPE